MGSSNSTAEGLQYKAKEWEEVERLGLYEVMRNRKGQQAHLYHFNLKEDFEIEEEIDTYQRRRSAANWVQVLGANVTSSGFGFCGSQENVCVLTEPIVLLNSLSRLNKQQSAVTLYNALRGYFDLKSFVVPAAITDKMLGFNKRGQTKVWINENFGMNHAGYHHSEAQVNESEVLRSLVNAISSKLDLPANLLEQVKNAGSLTNAMNIVRSNSGVAANVLEGNNVNFSAYTGQGQVQVLRDTTPIQPAGQTNLVQQKPASWVQPQQQQPVYYQPPVGNQVLQSGFRNQPASFVHPSGAYIQGTSSQFVGQNATYQSSYQVPRYADSVGTNKFSFTAAQ